MTARRVILRGRVVGVGYREWMVQVASQLGLSGWVRNRSDGSVEALIDGDEGSIDEMLRACRRGPPLAEVTEIEEHLTDPPEHPGFTRLPTA
jgi:acylphosphatase